MTAQGSGVGQSVMAKNGVVCKETDEGCGMKEKYMWAQEHFYHGQSLWENLSTMMMTKMTMTSNTTLSSHKTYIIKNKIKYHVEGDNYLMFYFSDYLEKSYKFSV